MNIKEIGVLTLLCACSSVSANELPSNYPSPAEMLSSLIVSPYAFNNDYFNKMIVFKNLESGFSCNHSDKGRIIFSDVEGGRINTFSDYKLTSPGESITMSPDAYYSEVKKSLSQMKKNRCLDVNLAPVIDLGYGNRSYFQNDKVYQEHMDAFVKANKDAGVKITYKHYPPNKFTKLSNSETSRFNEAKLKWAKAPENLSSGYSEIEYGKFITGDYTSEYRGMMASIKKMLDSSDLIMLDNNLYAEADFLPYVASELPQRDKFLQSFSGLIITDDLYQLNIDEIDVANVLKNSDLYIITSLEDTRKFHNRLIYQMAHNPELLEVLKNKYDKVTAVLGK